MVDYKTEDIMRHMDHQTNVHDETDSIALIIVLTIEQILLSIPHCMYVSFENLTNLAL